MRALYIAMQAEAQGLLEALGARPLPDQPVIGSYYRADDLLIVTSGKDRATGADCIGTEPAALIAHDLITNHGVTSLLNAGTCGAHSSLGAEVADAYLIAPAIFNHDHRIPLPDLEQYGLGAHPSPESVPALAKALNLPTAILSSGNSLDHTERDLELFLQNGAQLKDMEGSALAWVCRQHDIPLTCLKIVTDIFDLPHPAAEQFQNNLARAAQEVTRVTLEVLSVLKSQGNEDFADA
jgi:nucleoside phosphorylase